MKRISPTLKYLVVLAIVFGGMAIVVERITRPASIFPTPEQQAHLDHNRALREAAATKRAAEAHATGKQSPVVIDVVNLNTAITTCVAPQTEVTATKLVANP
ncbi:MAG: hypothetical protein DI628_01335 [Blastochloris viridis]|uniref:Uncharacterized protein n=1 Tax=Blastochloris viridis TaxID=1079 RepID=A0A6N4RB91_BLAVI|nr:MAG: hypothetical protein DI628_01335 [Blastochloris viridis]